MHHIILPLAYNINRWRKVEEKRIIFADAHHKKCPNHMKPLLMAMQREGYAVEEVYFDVSRMSAFSVFTKMIGFMRLYAMAETVVISDYFLPVSACRKKKATKVIQLWHGAGAFKKFGYDSIDDIPIDYKGNVHRNYNLVTVSGDECVKHFSSAMRVMSDEDCKVLPLGIAVTDKYYDREYIDGCRAKFRYEYPDAVGKRIVLWAPTFRGNASEARLYGEDSIDALIEYYNGVGDVYLIKSVHPHSDNKNNLQRMNTSELMVISDVLITDYSSVFFDYLLFDKPIIFYAPDFDEYKEGRGFYLDYSSLPGTIIKNDFSGEALKNAIELNITRDENESLRQLFKEKYMNGCDGRATERIVDYVKGNLVV